MALISLYDFYKKVIPPRNLIIQASEITGKDKNDEFNYSIGLSYNFWVLDFIDQQKIQIGEHKKLVLSCFNYTTDQRRRGTEKINRKVIHNTLLKNGIVNQKLEYIDYIKNLSNYKFVISPEGNGRDCHRHYEAILCGCIPVIEYNEDIVNKYSGLPVLYTKDYSEITPEYLKIMYKKIIFQKFNFSKLFLNYFSEQEINEINEKSKYWKNKKIT